MNKYSDLLSRTSLKDKLKINENLAGYKSGFSSPNMKSSVSCREFFPSQSYRTNGEKYKFGASSPGISEISAAQNQLISNISLDYLTPQEKILKLPDLNCQLRSDKNFSNLIEKLDEVIFPKQNHSEINLNDLESHLFKIDANFYQCYKIKVKSKKSPIFVKFKIYSGKLKIFYSLTDPKPGLSQNSFSSTKDFFKISDNFYEFKADFLYLGVKSLVSSSFQIFFHFGRSKIFKNYKTERTSNENPEHSFEEIDYENEQEEELKNKSKLKNFVRINLDAKVLTPQQKQEEIQSRSEKWKNNRERALVSKKNNIKQKKKKTVQMLNQRILRLEEETLKRERIERHIELQQFNTSWMKIMIFFKITESIRNIIREKRGYILSNIQLNQKALKIQRLYKRKISVKDLKYSESVALFSLKLFHQSMFKLSFLNAQMNLASVMKTSANTSFLFDQVSTFFKKVILIQRSYRKFAKTIEVKLRALKMQWNKCVDKAIYTKRSNSIRKRESIRLLSIPNVVRDNIIKEYFYVCLKEFMKETRKYLQGKKKKISGPLYSPDFKYLPTEGVMENLIKSCVNYKLRP